MTVPGTPDAIETLRTISYTKAVGFQLAEMPGKLRPLTARITALSDKSIQIEDRFDDLQVSEIVGRHTDTVHTDADIERRWIHKPRPQRVSVLLSKDDMAATEIDPKAPIARQSAVAVRRAHDDRWLQGFYGNAYTGETGTTAVPFKSANIMAVNTGEAAPAGITLNKLIAMQETMRRNLVDTELEKPVAVITAKQITDLLKINQLQNRDYNPQLETALQSGRPMDFMGFTWVPSEIGNSRAYPVGSTLSVDGSGYRRVPFLVSSGMYGNMWEEFFARVTEESTKEFDWQVYARTTAAFTRLNEDKCYQMLCLES
jgi:DNA topoisomerase VI subunit B